MRFTVLSVKKRNWLARQLSLYPLRVVVENEAGKRYNLNCESGPHTLEWSIREALAKFGFSFWGQIVYAFPMNRREA